MTAATAHPYVREDLDTELWPVFDEIVRRLGAGESVLMVGPPGVGKTMIARRVAPYLREYANQGELAETRQIRKLCGLEPDLAPDRATATRRPIPWRAPHHTCSVAGLLGGGRPTRPGEVSLAHGGLLFLDEVPEFSVAALSGVKHANRAQHVDFYRAAGRWTYPARFSLLGAANPCPCGWRGDSRRACTCPDPIVERYLGRIPDGMFSHTIQLGGRQ